VSNLPDFLGSYRLARFVRSGNSSQIWEAYKGGGKERVVLKVLRRDHWGNREQIGYLKHEYEVGHSLSHPNVIGIYDFATEGKIAFIVLELFAPTNLKQALRASHERVLYHFDRVVQQSLSALQHLHEKKWVHCDIKPDNFLINDEGETRLIDFTIAKRISKNPLGRLLGGRGPIRGTRSYMSPEQIRGRALDARSDVYSFGCMMYELLTGKVPYTGSSPDDLLNKHLTAAIPSPQVHNHQVTDDLQNLVRRMMAKDRDSRPKSMEDALKEFRSSRSFKVAPRLPEADDESGDESGDSK
jgi:serine/threonine protein kinase